MKKYILTIALTAIASTLFAQGSLVEFLNPTNTFLQANELNITTDIGYQENRNMSYGLGARFWISDSQGAAISYEEFPHPNGKVGDSAEWQIGYGYRTAYKSAELDVFAGMADDVDDDSMLFRPYIEFNMLYQTKSRFAFGPKVQITNGERPFFGLMGTYKFTKD